MFDSQPTYEMVSGAVKEDIAARALQLGITGTPGEHVHHLGTVKLSDGREVAAHCIHAIDPIITDGIYVVLINRVNAPGKGMPALPGGWIDPLKGGGIESAIAAAVREALEETGIALKEEDGVLIGQRNMYRPHDVRIAAHDLPQYGIKKGEVFMVSTQAVKFTVPDLSQLAMKAGDDAEPGSARPVKLKDLTREMMGIPDHYDMIIAATKMLGATPVHPHAHTHAHPLTDEEG